MISRSAVDAPLVEAAPVLHGLVAYWSRGATRGALLVAIAACYNNVTLAGDGGGGGAGSDAPGVGADAARGVQPAAGRASAAGAGTMLLPALINTDTFELCDDVMQASADVCVIARATITIDGRVTAVGSRPLALISAAELMIPNGITVTVSSVLTQAAGAGSNPGCPVISFVGSGLGGPGGSFGSPGGDGGVSNASTGTPSAPASVESSALLSGCPGMPGNAASAGTGGNGGFGGGALYLFSSTAITVDGTIEANGEPGGGGGPGNGGGGGGTGGMLFLSTPGTVTVEGSGQLLAEGGGGGAGGGVAGGGNGSGAAGGVAMTCAGSGGSGATDGDATGGDDGSGTCGAGGGGGGAGQIWIHARPIRILRPTASDPGGWVGGQWVKRAGPTRSSERRTRKARAS